MGFGRACLAAMFFAVSCQAGVPATATPPAEPALAAVMAAIDTQTSSGLDRLEDLVDLGRGARDRVAPLLDSAKVASRFAGVFYFSRLAEKSDTDTVAKALQDADLGNRVTAAATLLRLGDRRGVSLLEEARRSDGVLSFSKPPELLRDYAAEALGLATLPAQPASAAGGTRGFAAPLRGPMSDVSVIRTGDTINVTVRMQFRGRGATQGLIDEWVKTAKALWNGKHGDSCCTVALGVETALEGPDRPGYVQVRVDQNPIGARARAFVDHLGGKGRDEDLKMRIASNRNGYVFAHELSHVLGVDDDYHDVNNISVPNDAARADLQAGRGPDLMAQTWPEAGVYPVVQARHVEAMLKQYNVAPPVAQTTTAPPAPSPSRAATPSPTAEVVVRTPSSAPRTAEPATAAPAAPTPQGPTTAPTVAPPPQSTSTLSPARDLTGTWRGGFSSTGHYQGAVTCNWTGTLTLVLTQSGSALNGNATLTFPPGKAVLAGADCGGGTEQYGLTGTVSASSVRFQFTGGQGGWYGTANGSFTTDLMSGTFSGSGSDYGTGCFRVSRTSLGALPGC